MPDERILGGKSSKHQKSSLRADQASDYALWLVPSGTAHTALSSLIQQLSSLEAESPSFASHITLWYPIPIDTPLESITADLTQIVDGVKAKHDLQDWTLQLGAAQKGEKYYQSVLAPVKPTAGLLALRHGCEGKWGPSSKAYFPHLSLFYGYANSERRQEIADRANRGFGETKLAGEVVIGEIVVVDSRGTADEWKVVSSVKL